jgi:protease-4
MRTFFKIFFASLLALFIFSLICFFLVVGAVSGLTSKEKTSISEKSVLVLDLSQHFNEQLKNDPLSQLTGSGEDAPGLYDVLRLIKHAKDDKHISGIYITGNGNANGFASNNELRMAIQDFKTSKKFVLSHADLLTQGVYFVSSVADKLYVNPAGGVDWSGFNVDLAFLKGTLDKLEIQPQIFYAGKFKSATEPFRTDKMTPENKLQTTAWLSDLYNYFLMKTAEERKIDAASLHALANAGAIQTPQDALRYKLVDGLKYDDEVKDEIKKKLGIGKYDKMSFVSISKYADAADYKQSGKDKIALIYAEGDIVDGNGSNDNIGGDKYRKMIRKARLDKSIKAIVLRINSGGGSALASENIWRELSMAKKDKPVVVSFGDVAASGGYYIAAGADSIFTSPNTITGSIGVFGLLPNMQNFFKNKLGVTFDGVKTAEYADAGSVYRPLTETEKKFFQNSVDRIYAQFKQRVAEGRKKSLAYVDSIAQGRVWSGEDAVQNGLVDKIGNLQDAINCAARLAKTTNYRLREYPESSSWLERLLNKSTSTNDAETKIKEQVGEENFRVFKELVRIKQICGSAQARLPFQFFVN